MADDYKNSWDEDRDPLHTIKITSRGYVVISVAAITLLILALAVAGGIEQGSI